MNRADEMNLAMIREAVSLAQEEMTRRSDLRQDGLLIMLADYLMATGADSAAIVVSVHGQEYALDLDRFRSRERA